ncbi:MAG: hypothetical protein K0M63_05845 [Weeksellaceae bacterium]|nr:hypothetical protein [Weeksellaceae bacterium]
MAVQIKTLEYFMFNIGGYPDGSNEIRIRDDFYDISESTFDNINKLPSPQLSLDPLLQKELIDTLNTIRVTEWRRKYDDNDVMDGTQWELEILYNKRKTSKIVYGSNEYPYVDHNDDNIIKSKTLDEKPDFFKLLNVLNKIAKRKNYFY